MKKLLVFKNFFLLVGVVAAVANAQTFTKITTGSLVSDPGGFLGTAWGDYDGDGYVDLFVANYQTPNLLFHNNGAGSFTKVTVGEIVTDRARSYSATWGDYDNDGDPDLFVANVGSPGLGNFLYRNEGTTFKRMKDGDIAADWASSISASWADYDQDGDLDIFVANDGSNNFLYQNNGNGTFTKIISGPIVNDKPVESVIGLWGDYDNDGDLDLYVVNGYFAVFENFLYRNDGKGNFTKITTGRLVTDVEGSSGGSWGDYDNDGYLDMYVTNGINSAPNSLYHNNRDGTFTKITTGNIVTDRGHSIGSSWVDYDNDGDLDLFVANALGQKNVLYRNDGNSAFTNVTSGAIVNDIDWSFGCSWADYDNDGDQDVIVTNGGFYRPGRNFVYQNDGNLNKWISLQCKGTVSNASAIGAMIRIKATIAGKAVWQMRQISGQSGFLGQNSLTPQFGLGNTTMIDSLVVNWPSGKKLVQTNVAPNQFLKIVEESTTAVSDEQLPATPSRYRLADNYPNPFGSGATFSAAGTAIEFELARAGAVKLEIYDLLGQKIRTLVDQTRTAGVHRVVWDGKNDFGKTVASGIYLYGMTTSDFKVTKRLLLIR